MDIQAAEAEAPVDKKRQPTKGEGHDERQRHKKRQRPRNKSDTMRGAGRRG
jgi:hypothetical protein